MKADLNEELEPLFDYHRVQPAIISLDDDSDSSTKVSPKRRKISKTNDDMKEGKDAKTGKNVEVVDCEGEEDWLPSPPKNLMPASERGEDSTIKELRLKKLELESLASSVEDTLRAVEEAARKAGACFLDTSTQQDTEGQPKLYPNRAKIVILIQDKAGTKQYRVYSDERFEPLFKKYAEKADIDAQNLVFCFDGDAIHPASTPQGIGMEDGDILEAYVKRR